MVKLARPHLDAVLVTADLAAALTFWREILEFTLLNRDDGDASLAVGEQRLRVVEVRPTPPRAPGGLYAGAGYRVLGVVVDDLEAVCARITSRGRRVAAAGDLPGRWPIRFARDADGNMLELIGRPRDDATGPIDRLQVGMTVADADRVRAFLGDVLGLPEQAARPMGDGMTRHAFSVGHSTLKLWQRPGPLRRLSGPPAAAIGIRAVTLPVASLAEVLGVLEERGLRRAWNPGIPSSPASAWIEEPEGSWIELREPA